MPPVKITYLFEQTTETKTGAVTVQPAREAGWTESFIPNLGSVTSSAAITTLVNGFNANRTRLLTAQAKIIGARLHDMGNNATRAWPYNFQVAGQDGPCTLPHLAILARLYAVNGINNRAYEMRGISDSRQAFGELIPGLGQSAEAKALFGFIVNNFLMMAIDKTHPHFKVKTVVAGVVTLKEDSNVFFPGQTVQFYRTHFDDSCCGSVGQYKILAVTDSRHFTVDSWPTGKTASDGKVAVWTPPAPIALDVSGGSTSPNGWGIERLVTRKTGRPFDLFSGRRSRTCCLC